jgi:hypothetical protein
MKVSKIVITGAAALAACGVLGMVPPAVQASSASVATWMKQHPASSPPAGYGAAMAYDAATGTVVLFGLGRETWTWDGSTWTRQHPASSPPAPRYETAAMAYDAASGTVVLFGVGRAAGDDDTWTWDGTTWTKQASPSHPPISYGESMAYDPATGTVVLFGGRHIARVLDETWTWDGSTWTRQSPASSPPVRQNAAMAYDAATGTMVLFGGLGKDGGALRDTWTWDGSTWTRQSAASSPPVRQNAMIADDAATGTVVLFGGRQPNTGVSLGDTWTWDGSTWTQQAPASSPPARYVGMMAYDAAQGNVVLFGGEDLTGQTFHALDDTWTWG